MAEIPTIRFQPAYPLRETVVFPRGEMGNFPSLVSVAETIYIKDLGCTDDDGVRYALEPGENGSWLLVPDDPRHPTKLMRACR